jgi:hypothetical protein
VRPAPLLLRRRVPALRLFLARPNRAVPLVLARRNQALLLDLVRPRRVVPTFRVPVVRRSGLPCRLTRKLPRALRSSVRPAPVWPLALLCVRRLPEFALASP